jgi:CRP/FNR family transcriptional regulator, cyclic AMP receptor protein
MKTVLIIEDNPEIRENTSEILALANFRVITANNGKEGIAVARIDRPEIILCDIMMPEMDGYSVIKQIKNDPVTAVIPFIYVTARAEKREMKMALDMGADGYVTKPFDAKQLIDAIDKVIK